MPAMLSGHGRKSIAPQGAPTNPTTPLVGAGHARDALRAPTRKHRARGRSYRAHRTTLQERAMPTMLFGRVQESIAPQGAPTDRAIPPL